MCLTRKGFKKLPLRQGLDRQEQRDALETSVQALVTKARGWGTVVTRLRQR